jgi:hypothetical protein
VLACYASWTPQRLTSVRVVAQRRACPVELRPKPTIEAHVGNRGHSSGSSVVRTKVRLLCVLLTVPRGSQWIHRRSDLGYVCRCGSFPRANIFPELWDRDGNFRRRHPDAKDTIATDTSRSCFDGCRPCEKPRKQDDGEIYIPSEAVNKFLKPTEMSLTSQQTHGLPAVP